MSGGDPLRAERTGGGGEHPYARLGVSRDPPLCGAPGPCGRRRAAPSRRGRAPPVLPSQHPEAGAPGNVRVTPWHRPTLCSLLSRRSPPRPAALGSSTGQRPPPATALDMGVLDPRPPPALQLQGRPGSWASSSRGSPGRSGRSAGPPSLAPARSHGSVTFFQETCFFK